MKNRLLAVAVLGEVLTGLVLLVYPAIVIRLLFGTEVIDAGVVMSRITDITLIALGIACWPGCTGLCGMLTYSALATLYLLYVGIGGEWVGLLLWPAVVLHGMLTLLLARAWFKPEEDASSCQAGKL